MPGLEAEGEGIMRWVTENVSKDLYVHVMEQYHPRAHVGKERRGPLRQDAETGSSMAEPRDVSQHSHPEKSLRYEEIDRPVSLVEVASVRQGAEQAGLWRFAAAAEHGSFNL
jgi:putative pyruvate formate lyase activating enzyme